MGLKEGPLHRHLYDKEFGVFTKLQVALEDADDNYQQFMQMSPAQIMIGDSTTMISRSSIPLVPVTSKYWMMMQRSKQVSEKLMEKRADHPVEYNEQTVISEVEHYGLSTVPPSTTSQSLVSGKHRQMSGA